MDHSRSLHLFIYFILFSFFFFYSCAAHRALPLFPYTTLFRSLPPRTNRAGRPRIPSRRRPVRARGSRGHRAPPRGREPGLGDRKSTRLNSSHSSISYAVFCLKKKKLSQPVPHVRHGNRSHPPA